TQIEIAQLGHAHRVEECRRENVDAFCDLSVPIADDLRTEEPAVATIACDTQMQFTRTGVVRFVVGSAGLHGDRIKPGNPRLCLQEAGSSHQQVDDLYNLSAECAREAPPVRHAP